MLNKPKKCVFSITNTCSMRCKMCYNWRMKDSLLTLSKKHWIKTVKDLSKLKESEILLNIIGGEPLEIPYVFDIINIASKNNIKTSLTTNAYNIDKNLVDKIRLSGLDTLCISLDSLDPNIHDYYRGKKGVFKKVMSTIDMFSKIKGPEIIIQTIIMDKNLNDLPKIVKWANNHKTINGVFFMAVMKPHFTNLDDNWYKKDKLKLWPTITQKVSKSIKELIDMKKNKSKIVNSIDHLKVFEKYYKNPENFIKSKYCDVIDFGIYIDSIGDVFICNELGKIGNVKTQNLENIWFSYETLKVKKNMKKCSKNCEFLINCFYRDEN
jgi:hypothetical protein